MRKIYIILPIILSACATSSVTPIPTPALTYPLLATQQSLTITETPTSTLSQITTKTFPGQPYPRLGMVWPNPYEQPLDQIARYDWVILDNWMKDFVDPLRALNSDLLLLTSTNASEISFRPEDTIFNNYLQSIPYQWYLTQVGTSLRADVDDTQTTFPVQDLVIESDKGEIKLFIPGDTALIEGESVYIESVNTVNRTLIVRRGYIRPASAHKAGTRIAAHITFWPNSWLLNLSTLSPTGIADPDIGPERWADYNARVSVQSLVDPRWDGIFVDRSDPNESWLIGNSTARTIDPDQSNHLPIDYSAFDKTWNDGLRLYLDRLRTALGPERIILLNWGITQYPTVNGTILEGIPDDSWFNSWHSQIFGPNKTGSYFDWLSRSRQPNLTMIETYEDNSRTASTNTDRYYNRCQDTSFAPNYRKMRFGLTSALLNDGYFSYEMNTQGHGALCLMWFDEYDNAGQGRGYLGYPVGPAHNIADQVLPNLLPTKGFDSNDDLAAWRSWFDNGYKLLTSSDSVTIPAEGSRSVRIDIPQTQGDNWRATFSYQPLEITKDTDYTLFFYARADHPRPINAWMQRGTEPWDTWLDFGEFNLTTEWKKFEITLPSSGDDNNARLVFGMGAATGLVWLDSPRLFKGNADIWQRYFDNGIVLVNATTETITIQLDTSYRKINGKQDWKVNDGSIVQQITLPPKDGIILLREK